MTTPALIVVGADKGGVGKTSLSRVLIDYLQTQGIAVRAFDAEFPRGTLKRFHGRPIIRSCSVAMCGTGRGKSQRSSSASSSSILLVRRSPKKARSLHTLHRYEPRDGSARHGNVHLYLL